VSVDVGPAQPAPPAPDAEARASWGAAPAAAGDLLPPSRPPAPSASDAGGGASTQIDGEPSLAAPAPTVPEEPGQEGGVFTAPARPATPHAFSGIGPFPRAAPAGTERPVVTEGQPAPGRLADALPASGPSPRPAHLPAGACGQEQASAPSAPEAGGVGAGGAAGRLAPRGRAHRVVPLLRRGGRPHGPSRLGSAAVRRQRVRYLAQRQGADMWALYAAVSDEDRRTRLHKVTDVLRVPPALALHDPPLPGARPLARDAGDVLVFRLEGERRASRVLSPSRLPHLLVVRAGGRVEGEHVQGPYRTSDPNWEAFVAFRPDQVVVRGADRMFAPLVAQPVDVPTPPVAFGALPVFGDHAPDFRVTDPGRVAALVLGRERAAGELRRRGARAQFTPPWTDVADRIWATVLRMGSGSYFLRAYDAEDELLWSLGFDYAAGLEALELEAYDPVPAAAEDGDAAPPPPVAIVVRHRGCHLTALNAQPVHLPNPDPVDPNGAQRLAFALPLDRDRLSLELQARDGRRLDIVLPVRRLRWRLVREAGPPSEPAPWAAHTLALPADALRADSPWRLEIDLPGAKEAPPLADEAGRRLPLRPRRTETGTWSFPLNALYGAWPTTGAARSIVALVRGPDGSGRSLRLCRVENSSCACPLCQAEVPTPEALAPHVIDHHADAFFRKAQWTQYVARDGSLPRLVYQCECNEVIRADTPANATSAMHEHQMPRGETAFRVLKDPEDILAALNYQDSPRLFICHICHSSVETDDLKRHLSIVHGRSIVEEASRLVQPTV
jgi:hypothetical protein